MSGIAAIGAAAAVAGAATSVMGALKKGEGVAENNQAKDAITQRRLDLAREQNEMVDQINRWYNEQSKGFADQTAQNATDTIAKGDGTYITNRRAGAETDRTNASLNLLSGAPTEANYADRAPDSTGAVRSANARELAKALDLGKARAVAGAKINSYGDALTDAGMNTAAGAQNQQFINRQQNLTDKKMALKTQLTKNLYTPVLSDEAKYSLASGAGADSYRTGSLLQAGGDALSAANSYGVIADAYDGLFRGSVPREAGVYGPQVPGAITRWFS